jgi:uroporphyrinogen-III decarboxylase
VPQIREHVELTHSYGAYYDYYDDGKLMGSLQMIADTGVDVIETCTPPPVGDFDLATAKAMVGAHTTLKGYVDLLYVIKHGTPELVERTVREAMEIAKPGGGFIIGSSDSFREGTPQENLAAYWDACLTYGRY